MKIEFVNLKRQYASIKREIDQAIARVLKSQYFILGEELRAFEEEFASFLGAKYVVGVDNGSDGLVLALQALEIGPGDEVITPVNSFISTTFAITELGATPVFVDIDPATHQIDIDAAWKKITKETKAILPVHLYGAPCQIDELVRIAKKNKVHIVEDACQAHGSRFANKRLGTFGIMGVFSFYPGKNLGAYGYGGAICTNDKKIADKLKLLQNFGQRVRYYHDIIGKNSKLDDLQAAILRVKLKHLDKWNEHRNKWAQLYKEELSAISMPRIIPDGQSNRHLFVIEVDRRDQLQKYLVSRGIMAQIHYPVPIHLQKCYRYLGYKKGDFPVAERAAGRILSLPIYAELTQNEVNYVVSCVKQFYGKS